MNYALPFHPRRWPVAAPPETSSKNYIIHETKKKIAFTIWSGSRTHMCVWCSRSAPSKPNGLRLKSIAWSAPPTNVRGRTVWVYIAIARIIEIMFTLKTSKNVYKVYYALRVCVCVWFRRKSRRPWFQLTCAKSNQTPHNHTTRLKHNKWNAERRRRSTVCQDGSTHHILIFYIYTGYLINCYCSLVRDQERNEYTYEKRAYS